MKKSYHLRKFGLRITSGRHSREFGLKPKSLITDEARAWAKRNKKAILIERSISLGSSLAKVIKFILPHRVWSKADLLKCGCDKYESRMNRWGFRVCFHKRRQIVERLRQQAYHIGSTVKIISRLPPIVIDFASYLMIAVAFVMESIRYVMLAVLPSNRFN